MYNSKLPRATDSEPSRALTLVEGTSGAAPDSSTHAQPFRDTCIGPMAGFITQLIACRRRLPEYRTRRLADPAEATQRYDAVEHRPATARRQFERLY